MTPRRTFLLALTAYFLLGAAWAMALPVNGTYDEKQHVVRAYAVVTGQWVAGERVLDAAGWPAGGFDAPRSLLPDDVDCTWRPAPPKPASCQRPVTDTSTAVLPSIADEYHPIYYLPVGLPLLISPDETGIVWSRVVSALLSALLLAAATTLAMRMGNRLLAAALVLVSTPLAMNLAGSVNPNGLEISAGVLLFVALLALLHGPPTRARYALAGTAAVLLLTIRQLGPVLLVLIVASCALVAGAGPVRSLLRRRDTATILGGSVAAGLVAAVGWLLVGHTTEIEPLESRRQNLSAGQILAEIAGGRAEFYLKQIVAQFSYGETTVSPAMIGAWYLLIAALVLPALWFGGTRLRLAVIGLFVVCAAFLVALELYFVPIHGWFSQGRYAMPAGAGIVLLAAVGGERFAERLGDRTRLFATALALATVPLDLYALARVMTRFQRGIDAGLNPFGGQWQPATGPVLPLLAGIGGGILLSVIVWRIRSGYVRPVPGHSTPAAQPTTVGRSPAADPKPMAD